jgi:glycosyltransferase involved in cell wall biosynthesis/GT2 family glycosyltransferase
MKFSVIICTFRRPGRLRRTLDSMYACRPDPHEVIVVDGDPQRSAQDVVEGVSVPAGRPRPRYLPSPEGLTLQRNLGLRQCTGDVVVFFDDDVLLSPDIFLQLGDAYQDPAIVGATGRVIEESSHRFGRKESAIRRWLPGGGEEGSFTRFSYPRYLTRTENPRDVEVMQGCFMTARRDAALYVGFDEQLPGYGLAEDEDFSCRLARLGRIRYVPEALLTHEQASTSSYDSRTLSRLVVVNRSYLFRKNFLRTPLARVQFAALIGILLTHRLVNANWQGARGILEGLRDVRRGEHAQVPTESVSVTFVSSHARTGGSERYLESLLGALERSWIRNVVCLERGPLVRSLQQKGYDTVAIDTSRHSVSILVSAWKLRRLLTSARPDVIHANGVKAALCARLATLGIDLPLIWVKHDFAWDGRLARFIASGCSQVVGVSEAVVASVSRYPGVDVTVVNTGIDQFGGDRVTGRKALCEALDCSDDDPVIGLVGRLHPVKGHLEVIELVPGLLKRMAGLKVAIIGGTDSSRPEYADDLQYRVKELGIEDAVIFLGYRDDAVELMSGCDVLALPSVDWGRDMGREGFPLVGLEALAVGTPIVGYRDGGLPELVGECGLLVAPGDRKALEAALLQLLEDRSMQMDLGRCARERARTHFSLANMVNSLRVCYLKAKS